MRRLGCLLQLKQWSAILLVLTFIGTIVLLSNLRAFQNNDHGDSEAPEDVESRRKPGSTDSASNNSREAAHFLTIRKFPCLVEGTRPLQCIKEGEEVYLPFNKFLKKQFDVSGKLNKGTFEYYTSYARVRLPDETIAGGYDPTGPFGHFSSFNVETRERVRCLNSALSVPMSTQWDPTPYFYPIQVAQFALQHYSRYKGDSAPIRTHQLALTAATIIEEGTPLSVEGNPDPELTTLLLSWKPKSAESRFEVRIQVLDTGQLITLKYQRTDTSGYGECVWPDPLMPFDVYEEDVKEVTENGDKKYFLHFTPNKGEAIKLSFIYSLGPTLNTSEHLELVLDLSVDASKALALIQSRQRGTERKEKTVGIRLLQLTFYGPAELKLPIKQQDRANRELFLKSTSLLLANQNERGGWAVPVERVIADGRLLLKPGWHSAMAQGHALSVLVRAYNLSGGDERYVESCARALRLFAIHAAEGGVLNRLFGQFDWFEEYPTEPGTFVLNGFLYSLIGLWDASSIPRLRNDSLSLFKRGLSSLRTLLPLFDTGDGSIYDLRHIGLHTAPNLARWDYHSVHIYLLKWLHIITGENYLNEVTTRWTGYAHGRRAKHN